MGDSSGDSVSVDMEGASLCGKEHLVQTRHGYVSVSVLGDQDKPALVTYPDLGLNYMSCFQGLFFCPDACSLLLHNFCIYHISPPGHEFGASAISLDDTAYSTDDLVDQIDEVLNFFGFLDALTHSRYELMLIIMIGTGSQLELGAVMCMGVTAGAYVLTQFAMKYRSRVMGLILVSPICKAPCWTEWLYNKVMSNLLYFYGMCGVVKEILLKRYFSKEVRGSVQVPESDIVQACRRSLDERRSSNVWRFLEAINGRPDISDGLRKLQCRSLIFVGENSPFHSEALYMTSKLDRRYSALVEVCDPGLELMTVSYHVFVASLYECYASLVLVWGPAGSGMWINGDRGAASCNVDTVGVLPHGVWLIQAFSVKCQPKKPLESIMHCTRASFPRKHGVEVETDKDSDSL